MPEVIVIQEETTSLTIEAGPPGPIGPQGIQGPPGGTFYYAHIQSAPASDWVITHNLGSEPNTVVIVGGEVVEADVVHNSINQVTIHFSSPQTGKAVFS